MPGSIEPGAVFPFFFHTIRSLPMSNLADTPVVPNQLVVPVKPVFAAMMLIVLLGALEQSITAVALPVIANQLHGFALMAWVVSAYLVASTVVTPIYGKLSDIYGRRKMLTVAVTIFVLASVGCAMAQSMPQLVMMRVLQGIGGGGLLSVAQAAISDVISPRERGRIQGYFSSVWVGASMTGPIIGGYLTQYLSWHWIFWINLPVGVLAMVMMRRSLRLLPMPQHQARPRIDYAGAVLLAVGLTGLLMAITRIGQGVAVGESHNLLLLVGGVLIMAGFFWHEAHTPEPIIPLSILRVPTVAICCMVLFLGFFQMISMSVLLPLHLQMTGVAPEISALRLLPLTLSSPIGAYIAGKYMSRTGHYRNTMLCGALGTSAMSFLLAFIAPEHNWLMAATMGAMGFGIGMQFPTGLVASQNAVQRSQVGITTALTSFSRLLGGAVGVAVLTSVLIALLRNALGDFHIGAPTDAAALADSGDVMMQIFRAVVDSAKGAGGQALRDASEGAFHRLAVLNASVTLISPLLLSLMRELKLRDSNQPMPSAVE
ncbi:MAG: oxidoreductase [Herbaspirillum sp.]|jgi:EmrB/QacA subfamily drug resistance transporter|nr:oxidoreductase [Herbaspirillum sp.]